MDASEISEIHLPNGMTCWISKQDEPLARTRPWYARRTGRVWYVVSEKDCSTNRINLHRLIMNAPPGIAVDHINGNGLDNRRENLRFATAALNIRNMHVTNAASGFRGVYPVRGVKTNRWKVLYGVNGKLKYLGVFPNPESAHEAWLEATTRQIKIEEDESRELAAKILSGSDAA